MFIEDVVALVGELPLVDFVGSVVVLAACFVRFAVFAAAPFVVGCFVRLVVVVVVVGSDRLAVAFDPCVVVDATTDDSFGRILYDTWGKHEF